MRRLAALLVEGRGIAFITPSTVTGQEQEKQAVALAFADAYRRMYDEYRDSGLFSADVLRRVAEATRVRYVAQLKLQGFSQGSKNRFGLLDTTSEEPITLRELLERTAHDLVAQLP